MTCPDPFSSRFEVFGRESTPQIDDINQEPFNRLKRLLDLGDGGDGRVILVRAPRAGYGKTSVLQRLAAEFAGSHHFVRVNLVGGRRTDAARVLEYVLQALCHALPDSTTLTDLDLLARRILALGLEPLVASGEVPCQDREGALAALREQPTETFDFHHDRAVTAHWTKSNFEILGPRLAAELARISGASLREAWYWVELLFRFATTAPDNVERARLLFETVFRGDLQNQSESATEERLHGLLALLGAVTRLVLIVDDTEGLSTHPPAALELSSFLANVSQSCPGTLVVLSVNNDVWETAFLPLLPGGLADRLTEFTVSLEPLTREEARELVRQRGGERADEVLEKIEWPQGDLYARDVLKAASEAWASLEPVSTLKVLNEKEDLRWEAKPFGKSSHNLDDLPESLEDDLDSGFRPAASGDTASASPFRAGKEGPALTDDGAESTEKESDSSSEEPSFAAGPPAGESENAPPAGKSAARDLDAAAASVGEDDSAATSDSAIGEDEAGTAAESVSAFTSDEPDEPNAEESGDDTPAGTAGPFAERSDDSGTAQPANPFAPAASAEPSSAAEADEPAQEGPPAPPNESGAPFSSSPAPTAEADAADQSDEESGQPAEPSVPANPFRAVTAPPANPFSATGADSKAPGAPEDGTTDDAGTFDDPAEAKSADEEADARPFAAAAEPASATSSDAENPFSPAPAVAAPETKKPESPEPEFSSPDSASQTEDADKALGAPAGDSPFTPKPASFASSTEPAGGTPPPASPFTGSQPAPKTFDEPEPADEPKPAASPFAAGNETPAARPENPFAPAPSAGPASGSGPSGAAPSDEPAEGRDDSPASDGPSAPEKPGVTPPPLPQDSPFAAGQPAPPPLEPSQPAGSPAAAESPSPPPAPASPFASMGGSTADEKDLGGVSSIFDPIRPDNQSTLDPEKLKPLLDRADQSPPPSDSLAPSSGSGMATPGAAPPPPQTPDPASPPASGPPPLTPDPSGPPPLSGPPAADSPFKPIASTSEDSPFQPPKPAESANPAESGFGSRSYEGLRESSGESPEVSPSAFHPKPADPPAGFAPDDRTDPKRPASSIDLKTPGTIGPSSGFGGRTDAPSPFRTTSDEDNPGGAPEPSQPESSIASPFKPVAQQEPAPERVSPFATSAGGGTIPQGLSAHRTELPPKQAQPSAPPPKQEAPTPFEPGSAPVESAPPSPAPASESPADPDDDDSPFATVGDSHSDDSASSFSVPATSKPDQDKVDELLRQFKARYANDQ